MMPAENSSIAAEQQGIMLYEMGTTLRPRRLWLRVVVAFCVIVSFATIVGFLFGTNVATQTLALTTALVGAVAGSLKIFPSPSIPKGSATPAASLQHRAIVAVVLFSAGVLAGYVSPRIAGVLFPHTPIARVSAEPEVAMNDRAALTWRNVPQQDEVWLLVCHKGVYYPQEYRVRSIPEGTVELIPVVAAPEAQKELQDHIVDGLGRIPVGALRFKGLVVRRKMLHLGNELSN
jgi:hypothetical protein